MKYLSFLIYFLLIQISFAQTGKLVGVIQDKESEELLPGANILIKELNIGATSDQDGVFIFEKVNPGVYTLQVTYLGYREKNFELRIDKDITTEIIIKLQPTILKGKELVVLATQATEGETPAAFSTLEKEEIQTRYYAQDIPVMLSELPSTKFYSENGNGIGYNYLSIRGFGQRRISIMINGIPQNDPEDHNVYWIDFPDFLENTEDIQVQRGAGSAFYGPPAIGGSINIRSSRFSPEPALNVYTGLGGYNTSKLSISLNSGLLNDKFIITGRLSRIRSDGYRDNAWVDLKSYFLGIAYFTKRSSLRLHFYGGPIEDHLAYFGIPKSMTQNRNTRRFNPLQSPNDVENFHQPHLDLIHQYQLKDNLTLNNTLFGIRGYGFFDYDGSWAPFSYFRLTPEFGFEVTGDPDTLFANSAFIRANVDNKQIGWLPNLTWTHNKGNVIFGSEFRVHRSLHWGRIQEGSDDLPLAVSGEWQGHNYIGERRYYEYKGAKNIISPYLQTNYRLNPKIDLNFALQYIYQNYRLYDEEFIHTEFDIDYNFLNPRLGVNFLLTPQMNLFISYARISREPRLKNYYDAAEASTPVSWGAIIPQFDRNADGSFNFDEPFVKPEQLNDLELGFGYRNRTIYGNVNLFYMDFKDEIVNSGGLDRFGQPVTGNADRTLHTGIELSGGIEIARNFTITGNFTFSENELKNYVIYESDGTPTDLSGNPVAGFPDVLANLRATYAFRGFSISVSMQHVGKQYTDNFGDLGSYETIHDENFVDHYTAFHSVLAYDFSRLLSRSKLTLQLHVQNIFDTLYNTHGYYSSIYHRHEFFPAAERHFFLNVKLGL